MYREVRDNEAMGYLATKPTIIITTLHSTGIVNAGVFGAYTNLSPSQAGFAISTGSHTYRNILEHGEFTVNVPGVDLVKKLAVIADSIPPKRSEIDEAGLSTKSGLTSAAPSIVECVAAVEFEFEKEVEIGVHSLMIGRCTGGWIKLEYLDADGGIDIFKAKVVKDFKYPQPLYMLPGEVVEG